MKTFTFSLIMAAVLTVPVMAQEETRDEWRSGYPLSEGSPREAAAMKKGVSQTGTDSGGLLATYRFFLSPNQEGGSRLRLHAGHTAIQRAERRGRCADGYARILGQLCVPLYAGTREAVCNGRGRRGCLRPCPRQWRIPVAARYRDARCVCLQCRGRFRNYIASEFPRAIPWPCVQSTGL